MTDQLLVPRELLERLRTRFRSAQMFKESTLISDLLAQPAASKPKPDSIGGNCWSCKQPVSLLEWNECDGYCPHCDAEIDEAEGITYPAPAGVVLPERRMVRDSETILQWHKDCEWNACLDEVARLNAGKPC